jgi:DNA-binding GntR family transcriptional regulator
LAGNRTLNQIVKELRKKILRYRFQSLNLPGRFEYSLKEHRELLTAFRDRDAPKAEKIMKKSLAQTVTGDRGACEKKRPLS